MKNKPPSYDLREVALEEVRAPEHVKPGRRVYMPDLYELTIERVEVTCG